MSLYVRQFSRGKGDGSSPSNACSYKNIPYNKIKPGDIVYLCGTFTSGTNNVIPFNFFKSGALNKPITIKSYKQEKASIFNHYLYFVSQSFLTFKDINFFNCGAIGGDNTKDSTHITISGCMIKEIATGVIRAIEPRYGNNNWTIKSCTISDVPNGIYSTCNLTGGANNLTIRDNIILNIFGHQDSHAIGIQSGSGHTITGNRTSNTGTAICCWAPSSQKMTDLLIEKNSIMDAKAFFDNSLGSGIEISGSYNVKENRPEEGWRKNIRINDNIIDGCENGIRATLRDKIIVTNNSIINNRQAAVRIVNPFKGE